MSIYGNPPPKPLGSHRSRPATSDVAIMLAANARRSALSLNMLIHAPRGPYTLRLKAHEWTYYPIMNTGCGARNGSHTDYFDGWIG